ncbi:MAG: hypothetical protein ACRELC_12920, partial [Gemmatimonadota bacterium]
MFEGVYRVYAARRLTGAEAQAAGEPIRAFGDGRTLYVEGATDVTLALLADRPGGLLISEVDDAIPPPWETGGGYLDGMYVEVYNNSDEVIFLDGLVFSTTYRLGFQDYDHMPCSASQAVRSDSTGLYVGSALQFPGSGAEYPIFPGEAKVMAHSAIDHTPVHPELLNLENADFEGGGRGTRTTRPYRTCSAS